MKWINPREELPKVDQLIWVLRLEDRGEDEYPAAQVFIALAVRDAYGVIYAREINHKGYPSIDYYFYRWDHHYYEWHAHKYEEPYEEGTSEHSDVLLAWLPFEKSDIPVWNEIDYDESYEIINSFPKYKERLQSEKSERNRKFELNKATQGKISFIYLEKLVPDEDGVYVVANKDGIWLSKYEKEKCDPWIAPNGKKVLVWYPVPSHY